MFLALISLIRIKNEKKKMYLLRDSPRPALRDTDLPTPTPVFRPCSLRAAAPGTVKAILSSREPRLWSSIISASFFSLGTWETKVKVLSNCFSRVVTGRENLLVLRMPSKVFPQWGRLEATAPLISWSPRGDDTLLLFCKRLDFL